MKSKAENLVFPKEFLCGLASSATQIEGGCQGHVWYRWSQENHIKDHSSSLRAGQHWQRVDQDLQLLSQLGVQTYRMGLEWARIQPSASSFDEQALVVYRTEILKLKALGIKPLLTLFHFNNPLWFEDSGGWMRADAATVWLGFVDFVVEGLGDLVSDWITINEPNVYLYKSFLDGEWPPGERSLLKYLRGGRQIIKAHRLAYNLIHRKRKEKLWDRDQATLVGVAHHLRIFDPLHKWNLVLRVLSAAVRYLIQDWFLYAMTGPKTKAAPRKWADFIGINYYTRDMMSMSFNASSLFTRQTVKKAALVNDLGWEIYPEGLYRLVKKQWKAFGLPIWITENGVCDRSDALRTSFIADHLAYLLAAIETGVKVERYYHWTLYDNFEWTEGEAAPFGLFALDFETQERTMRPSGQLYAQWARSKIWKGVGQQ